MYVPLLSVEPGQYEVVALNSDGRHVYTRLNGDRLPAGLHEALRRLHTPEGVTAEDRKLATEVLQQYGSLQLESDVMRCKLYALLLPAYAILGDRERFEQSRALLLVALYGCTNCCLDYAQAHAVVDPWRTEQPLKKSKAQLIRRLDDYDRWLGHLPASAGSNG